MALLGAVGVYYRKQIQGGASDADTETAIRNFLADNINGLPAPNQAEVAEEYVVETIQEATPEDTEILTLDGTYYAPTTAEDATVLFVIGEILSWFPYRPERFDCENYASFMATLSALVFGINTVAVVIDWSESHAYNLVVTAEGEAIAIEPQSGEVVELGAGDYSMERGRVHV